MLVAFLIRVSGYQNTVEGRLEESDKTVPSQG
jgi:hypothetical protein